MRLFFSQLQQGTDKEDPPTSLINSEALHSSVRLCIWAVTQLSVNLSSETKLSPLLLSFCGTQVCVSLVPLKQIPCLSSWWLWIVSSYLQFSPSCTAPLEYKYMACGSSIQIFLSLTLSEKEWPETENFAFISENVFFICTRKQSKAATRCKPCCWSFVLALAWV